MNWCKIFKVLATNRRAWFVAGLLIGIALLLYGMVIADDLAQIRLEGAEL
ncbi:hypothetical protein L0128_05985 [candidate division KSB1 bacterium]|nr:hypothetical protein [candidate division KSB1 bacterium]